MSLHLSRRQWLAAGSSLAAAATLCGSTAAQDGGNESPFRYCLNTSTIRGQKLSVPEQIRVAAEAGYDGIEPWTGDLQAFVESGGKLADLRWQIEDAGLVVASAIGFANWIVDDDARRAGALEAARRDMELVRGIGGSYIAAPPAGATDQTGMELQRIAERYRALLVIGESTGVVPQLELWGFSKTLSRLGELAYVAAEAAHPQACVLPDVYHIYKGGSDFHGLRLFSGQAMHVFHINDYPADPPRETIRDAHRVYPGDGVAPLTPVLRTLQAAGFRGLLSLELFNPQYWQEDALAVARRGLEKMRAATRAAFPA
jgi:2-keto-myo-inositol isomerase